MPKVRGKFKVTEVRRWSFNRQSAYVTLESVEEEASSEDGLNLSTASASMTMMITNQALVDRFPIDQRFEVDFTPVE
jgi:hypothetical protein